MSAPNSQQRRACWDARDEFWKCLDYSKDDAAACDKHRRQFETNCPAQWVKHFIKRRDFQKYKEEMESKGFQPLKEQQNFSSSN